MNEEGRYTERAPRELWGKSVIQLEDGIVAVLNLLTERGLLLRAYPLRHRYPYDWRSKQPVIQMATRQWFITITPTIRDQIERSLSRVEFIPASGRARLLSMIEGRSEWCISRQRSWGVPIPAFYERSSGQPLLDATIVRHFAHRIIPLHGSDAWWSLPISELLPSNDHNGLSSDSLVKGLDTLDVWFDSGTFWTHDSWEGTTEATMDATEEPSRMEKYGPPPKFSPFTPIADLYIEGVDQYRGWFQSSLITSVVARGVAPFRRVIAHGFVLDERGQKMSKSLGNVVAPTDVIRAAGGTDGMRLWALSANYQHDVTVGPQVLARAADSLQRLRNALRFVLGNLSDFGKEEARDGETEINEPLDRMVLAYVRETVKMIQSAYDRFDFARGLEMLLALIREDLSAVYFDSLKNRLYLTHGRGRRSAQATLAHLYSLLCTVIRPIAPYLVAEAATYRATGALICIDRADSMETGQASPIVTSDAVTVWEELVRGRRGVQEKLFALKSTGSLASTYQAIIGMRELSEGSVLRKFSPDNLAELFMVAKVIIINDEILSTDTDVTIPPLASISTSDLTADIIKSVGFKCPRCWVYLADTVDTLCHPCTLVMTDDQLAPRALEHSR